MARRVFFSFHFANDFWRTQQTRNINVLEGQALANPNAWEQVKRTGNASIKKWIDDNMFGKSCVVVLVGSQTADRLWVIHEISKGWNNGKSVIGIRINKLVDANYRSSIPGSNPFSKVSFNGSQRTLADVVPLKIPAATNGRAAYASISNNIETWIEEAIKIRGNV